MGTDGSQWASFPNRDFHTRPIQEQNTLIGGTRCTAFMGSPGRGEKSCAFSRPWKLVWRSRICAKFHVASTPAGGGPAGSHGLASHGFRTKEADLQADCHGPDQSSAGDYPPAREHGASVAGGRSEAGFRTGGRPSGAAQVSWGRIETGCTFMKPICRIPCYVKN